MFCAALPPISDRMSAKQNISTKPRSRGRMVTRQLNKSIKYVLYGGSRTAGARRCFPTMGSGAADTSAAKQPWQGCGPGDTYGEDTCVGYASQHRTPRHGNGGRHVRPMERLCQLPFESAYVFNVNCKSRTVYRCGFCRLQ